MADPHRRRPQPPNACVAATQALVRHPAKKGSRTTKMRFLPFGRELSSL
jgi:hypothetical protein